MEFDVSRSYTLEELGQFNHRQLVEARVQVVKAVNAFSVDGKGEHRNLGDLSEKEGRDFDRLTRLCQLIDTELNQRDSQSRNANPTDPTTRFRNIGLGAPYNPAEQRTVPQPGILLRCTNGREVRAYAGEVAIADTIPQEERGELSVGRALTGMVTGDWGGAQAELRAMQTGSDSAGGYLLGAALSARLIDLARNQSVVNRAGALTLPMDSGEIRIAGVASDPTASWRNEGKNIPASEMSFNMLTLKARTLAALIPLTIEMIEDAANAPALLENAVRQALGLALDSAALMGAAGGPEPLGLSNAPSVNETTGVGGPDYDDILDAITDIETANGTPKAWVLNPRENGTFNKLKDDGGAYLAPPVAVSNLARFVSNQIPTNLGAGSNESEIFVGDFAQMLIGIRKNVTIELLNQGQIVDASEVTHQAVQEMKLFLRAYLRADVALIRPTHFVRLKGVTAS